MLLLWKMHSICPGSRHIYRNQISLRITHITIVFCSLTGYYLKKSFRRKVNLLFSSIIVLCYLQFLYSRLNANLSYIVVNVTGHLFAI